MPVPPKNKQISKKNFIAILICSFIITLAAVLYLATMFSPDIDVEIGGKTVNDVEESNNNDEDSDANTIDNRLKLIQMEDNLPGVSKTVDDSEESQAQKMIKEKLDNFKKDMKTKQKEEPKEAEEEAIKSTKKIVNAPVPSAPKVDYQPLKMSKIFVGKYATIDQAISMQNRLMEAGLNISPFVKDVNGYYVIQVGSYSSKTSAQNVQQELINAGFAARIIEE